MAWKVLVTDGLEANGKEIINRNNTVVDKKGIEAEELLTIIPEADALIVRGRTKVTADLLKAAKNLKVVGRMGVGVDNIDLKAAKENGVMVVNAAVATSEAVAELAMGMIFALARELPRADATMKAAVWAKKEFEGIELMGKTLGVLGYGNIGRLTGKYAAAMGMRVIAYDPYRDDAYMQSNGAEKVSLDELYAQSDFISIHMPLTPETKHMVCDGSFDTMKNGVRIVDAARGGVIDEECLLKALESGKVAGVALDVFEKEPPTDWKLIHNPKVIATPHIGAQTKEAQLRVANDIAEEVLRALDGQELRWRIV
ncbi:MAG TPA: hydroxyacid dehydrogenase [Anaerolineaceae bacterium]|nr:hydroxyacid dehydrogenase [Anaerolineaceae bacterium]